MAFYCSVVGTFHTLCYWNWDFSSAATAFIAFNAFVFHLIFFGGMYVVTDLATELFGTLITATRRAAIAYPQCDFGVQRKTLRAMGPVRVKEAGFRYVGRGAAPEFIDFYINQVIALVLAFR